MRGAEREGNGLLHVAEFESEALGTVLADPPDARPGTPRTQEEAHAVDAKPMRPASLYDLGEEDRAIAARQMVPARTPYAAIAGPGKARQEGKIAGSKELRGSQAVALLAS